MAQPTQVVAYHRQLAWRPGMWWRLFLSVMLGGLGLVVMSIVSAVVVLAGASALGYSFRLDTSDGIDAGEMLTANLGLALLIPLAAGLIRAVYAVPVRWLWSNRPGLRWSRMAQAAGVSAVVWSPFLVLGSIAAAATRSSPPGRGLIWFLAVVVLTTPLQAAGEECLFRGLLLQALGGTRLSSWACCLTSAVLFAVAHLQFAPALFADRLLLGVVLAYLAIRTGGLEAGIAIHAVKNLAVLIPAGLLGSVSDALDPHSVSWLPLIVDMVLLAIAVSWILALAARRDRRHRPDLPDGSSPAAAPAS